jgi:hypothetical protein
MTGDPDWIAVWDLEFDQKNVNHLAEHEVAPEDVLAVLLNAPRFFRNLPDRSGTHVMIGPDANGQFFFIALAPRPIEGLWRPITGWRLGRRGEEFYRRSQQ